MAANGIQGPATIQYLKDDNLSHIFQYLTASRDWYQASRVCTKWRDMIHNLPHVQDQIAFQPLKRLAGNVMQISPSFPAPPHTFEKIFGASLEFSFIHSKLIGVEGCSKRSKEIRLHRIAAGFPVEGVFAEKLLAITETVLFFASQDSEKNKDKLVLRNPATLEEITSLPLVEESTAVSKVSNEILGCFPISEAEFITIMKRGTIAKWRLGFDTVYPQESLHIFKKGSPSSYQITDAYHVQDFVFLNFNGEIDSTVAPLQATRFRKENVLVALDIKKFKIVEPLYQVGKMISASSDFLYTNELEQMKGIAVSVTKLEDKEIEKQTAFTLTSRWQAQENPFARINERWFVTWKGEKDFYQIDIYNAKNGYGFFSVQIEYHSVKLGELSELCLRDDILALRCGRFIFLWHIPTKKRFLSFKINDLDGYDKRLHVELQDIQLHPQGLLLLFLYSKKHSSAFDQDSDEEVDVQEPLDDSSSRPSYRIVNIPYSNPVVSPVEENPLAFADMAPAVPPQIVVPPQAAVQPVAAQGRYAWLWPSYWWGIMMSGLSAIFRAIRSLFA